MLVTIASLDFMTLDNGGLPIIAVPVIVTAIRQLTLLGGLTAALRGAPAEDRKVIFADFAHAGHQRRRADCPTAPGARPHDESARRLEPEDGPSPANHKGERPPRRRDDRI